MESPWYHVRKMNMEGARNALQRLYGKQTDIENKLVAIHMTVAQDIATQESKSIDCVRGTNRI